MFKKLLTITFVSLFLTGCFGNGTSETETAQNKIVYQTDAYSIQIPYDWNIIEREDFTSTVPTDTAVVFKNNIRDELFTANLNIAVKNINDNISSLDLARSTQSYLKENIINFREISDEVYEVAIGDRSIETSLYTFQGKYAAVNPQVVFKQLYVAVQGAGYTLTAAYLPDEDETVVNFLDEMLKSFALK